MPLFLIQVKEDWKTSLINYLEILLGSGFKIIKLDMQDTRNHTLNGLIENINEKLNMILKIEDKIELSSKFPEDWIALEDYLIKQTKELNYKIIIAFDEYEAFHRTIVKEYKEDILGGMRSFIQSQNRVIFLFSGMLKLYDLKEPNWNEFFPQTQDLKVDYLSRDDSYQLITNPVDDFNLKYSEEVADEVYRLTMGHPQLLQTVCYIIINIANITNKKIVTKEMLEDAKEQVFSVNDKPIAIFWSEFCGDSEKEVIEQILANKEIKRDTKEEKRAVARLIDYGFITKDLKIRVPLFEKWLREKRDLI